MSDIRVISSVISREELKKHLLNDMFAKAVVDLERKIMAIGGVMHADEEQVLIDQGSMQEHLWGINLYPDESGDEFIEFDSMINIRPSQMNRSRFVENPDIRTAIRALVASLIA